MSENVQTAMFEVLKKIQAQLSEQTNASTPSTSALMSSGISSASSAATRPASSSWPRP
ncbi:hypothetical protein SAMN04515666_107169 [Bosea lupini]|uniref:Uncharacterized protein n=1 Tax=Bosea lupini TaxID=1036779 RepID=A0A1H7VN74_9HYPH|nr:hypothetical protein SAMN04515666_107169 [Bosea lupini]